MSFEQMKNTEEQRKIEEARKKLAKYKVIERKEAPTKESMKD
jgi:hypothetical protein